MLEEDDGGRRRNSCRFFGQFHFVATEPFGNAQGQAAKVRLCVDLLPVKTYHEPCTYGLIRCSAFRVAPSACASASLLLWLLVLGLGTEHTPRAPNKHVENGTSVDVFYFFSALL